jgi:hypothetical protein
VRRVVARRVVERCSVVERRRTVVSVQATEGASSASACLECAAGTYLATEGASACLDCGAGKYSGANASVCTSCVAGKYAIARLVISDGLIDVSQGISDSTLQQWAAAGVREWKMGGLDRAAAQCAATSTCSVTRWRSRWKTPLLSFHRSECSILMSSSWTLRHKSTNVYYSMVLSLQGRSGVQFRSVEHCSKALCLSFVICDAHLS